MAPPPIIFGQNGLKKVQYDGTTRGVWIGHCTGYKYPFAPQGKEDAEHRSVRWVDVRDLDAMLAFRGPEGEAFFKELT